MKVTRPQMSRTRPERRFRYTEDSEERDVAMNDSEVKAVLERAWKRTKESLLTSPRDRSEGWVDALAKELGGLYDGEPNIRVFWKGRKDQDFDRSEMLFDVAVCQLRTTLSIGQRKELYFVNECLWLVESELNSDSRPIIVDFSKLVMGASRVKLFVGGLPLSPGLDREEREKPVLEMCKEAARSCGGLLYFCFIPHPREWDDNESGPSVRKWKELDWCKL